MILSDLLSALGIPYTRWYADKCFRGMTFKSLFGLSKVLADYGVASEAYSLADKAGDLAKLTPPFLAHTPDGFVIVREISDGKVALNDFHGPATVGKTDFINKWDGIVMLAFPAADACEPGYRRHRIIEIANASKRWILTAALALLFAAGFVNAALWQHAATLVLTLITLAGIYVTYQLLLKSYNIHSQHGDAICGIIDRTGCHTVLGTEGAKFFGIFSWSEVGFAYFSVTLVSLLAFPQHIGSLAIINACCCPFSFWSVWYQKYRAKAWCTLCLITQACLWLSLGCYIWAGAFSRVWPVTLSLPVIACEYVAVLLIVNALSPFFDQNEKD